MNVEALPPAIALPVRPRAQGAVRWLAFSAVSAAVFALLFLTAGASPARAAFDPEYEQRNFSKINERATFEHTRPEYRALLNQQAIDDSVERTEIRLNDPERDFSGNLCSSHKDGCAGDVRLYRWAQSGYGITEPVLYIARSGAIISGHIWATRDGPAQRPGIVITTGSVQAPEELYLFAATTLAKKGYVVMTYDVQGQGRSDTFGEDPDRNEGVPAQQAANFINGTEDALRFFLSSPAGPYVPLPSATSGTVHSARQERRVAEGRNAPYNPLHSLVDPNRIGIVGHSLGATAISTVCCDSPGRTANAVVDAIVAWDNLTVSGGIIPRVPALGMSNDYGLTPTPYTAEPNPQAKNAASAAYSAAGVDTAQINIRGGTHFEYSYIPDPAFGATLRGMDLAAWYTAAWLDKYVKGDPTADARLLTDRWRSDAREAAIDPDADGNIFSRYLRSRIDIGLSGGGRVKCGDLRDLQNTEPGDNCTAATTPDDGRPPDYSYFAEARTPDPDVYARPAAASPIRVSLVPAFRQCGTLANPENGGHSPPLGTGACTPPAPSGSAHFGAQSAGSALLEVVPGDLATLADEADVAISASLSDVHSQDATGADYNPNAAGTDLTAVERLRLTDYDSGAARSEAATTVDFELAVPVDCIGTVDAAIGANCAVESSADALVPGTIKEAERSVVQVFRVRLNDSGPNGTRGDTDDALFAQQGIYAP